MDVGPPVDSFLDCALSRALLRASSGLDRRARRGSPAQEPGAGEGAMNNAIMPTYARSALAFERGEGAWYGNGGIYSVATSGGDHVMYGRDGFISTGKNRGIGRMTMHYRVDFRLFPVDIRMHLPLARRCQLILSYLTLEVHGYNLLR